MKTYFIINTQGSLIGWIDAVDEASAKEIAESGCDEMVVVSTQPKHEWYARHERLMQEKPELSFAA